MTSFTCLSKLIQNLKKTNEPFALVNAYKGNDWDKHISLKHPISLWKNDYMELYLKSWKTGQPERYYNNYSTIHTKILQGRFLSKMLIKNQLEIDIYLYKDDNYTFNPFSTASLNPLEDSFTLQMHYYHHLY